MLKRVVFILFVTLLSGFAPVPRLVKTKITDDITVLLPKDFKPMDDLDFSQRYPSVRKPVAAYTNAEREVDFSVNISATQWAESDVEMAQKFFKAGIFNMFDGVEIISEGVQTLSGKKFIFFEFESRVKGERSSQELRDPILGYTYIQYRIENGRTLVFSFNCPRRLREDWEETAHKMMKSVKMK